MNKNKKKKNNTKLSTLLSNTHSRERRAERHIEKIDLQRARRYGMKEKSRKGRHKYTHGGIVFIYDPRRKVEITSFPCRDASSETSGTRVTTPVLLPRKEYYEKKKQVVEHERKRMELMGMMDMWTSHSLLVVDMSGSMRRDDVNGARCRSDGVWMALARDYVKIPLEKGCRSVTDLVSVIVMKEEAEVLLECEPTDWVLYNKLLGYREWDALRPEGPGNYMPALDLSESLLMSNPSGTCSLTMLFFSDGKPSDNGGKFVEKVGEISSRLGRRLSLTCIGMADDKDEDFSTLNDMVSEAKSYGSMAEFGKPSLDADSLSGIISTLASSLTTSMTEMSDLKTKKIRPVRMDIKREKAGTPDDVVVTDDWELYVNTSKTQYVRNIWTWELKNNDFACLIDPRCQVCYKDTGAFDTTRVFGVTKKYECCPQCEAYYFCKDCSPINMSRHMGGHECRKYLHAKRSRKIVSKPVPSFSVAWKKKVFGEGAERIVYKFRFLDDNGKFKGPIMVAKDSRFIKKEGGSFNETMDYHREFMRTQKTASEYSILFNESLDALVDRFDPRDRDWVAKLPRITFLEPMVVEVKEGYNHEKNILIEKMLEGNYTKFNNNMGYVLGQSRKEVGQQDVSFDMGGNNQFNETEEEDEDDDDYDNEQEDQPFFQPKVDEVEDFSKALHNLHLGTVGDRVNKKGFGLDVILEGNEDDDDKSDESSHKEEQDNIREIIKEGAYNPAKNKFSNLKDTDFPQAFSHYTYEKSRQRFIVVDLQGVFNKWTRSFELTDPVIHKNMKKNRSRFRQWSFGRTDRGEKGVRAFFETHKCTDACKLLGLSEVRKI